MLFYAAFLTVGGAALVVAGLLALYESVPVAAILAVGAAGLLFGGIGAALLWSGTEPIVFDRSQGLFWKGRSPTGHGAGVRVELASIHAVQLVSEYCSGHRREDESRHGFNSYELNLVLKDGQRVNVVDHGDLPRLRDEGFALARFLGVWLWDPAP
jgi:hypothetical protein